MQEVRDHVQVGDVAIRDRGAQLLGHRRERRSVFATYGVVAGLAAIGGVPLGGVLTSADLLGTGWRAIFLVNVPVAAIVLAAAVPVVPDNRASSSEQQSRRPVTPPMQRGRAPSPGSGLPCTLAAAPPRLPA
ncbi:MAG: chloride channel protein [Candidatus Dormibacteraeota bacterium]|nr:chloride channel protein [Candidatus Dormibacteraeota bacterium]